MSRLSSVLVASVFFALAATTAPVMAKKQKLKEWYTIEANKALVKLDLTDIVMVLDIAQEQMIDRNGYVIQYLTFKPAAATMPVIKFVITDLGYSDRTFGAQSGDTSTFADRVGSISKGAKISDEGKMRNQYGPLRYVRYTDATGAMCIAVKQFGGFTGAGDSRTDEGGSTIVEGFFCADPEIMTDAMEQTFISGYRADL